uniref:Protein kinase domain-containing protein n=1 Tax=Leersia perrieri TaxID=77586 RepID=A0A0D9XLV6_9ORYZ
MATSLPLAVVLLLAVAASLPASNGQQTAGFSPQFAVLLACGAGGDVVVTTDSPQRTFVPDDGMLSGSSSRRAARLTNPDTSPPSPLYAAARGGASAFSYRLGYSAAAAPDGNTTLVLRLHFFPFAASQSGDLSAARFSVSAMGRYVLLRSFSPPRAGGSGAGVVREFFLPSDGSGRFDVTFTPESGGIAFVNAVELFPAPAELLWKTAVMAVNAGVSPSYQALETLYRLNVGGASPVTPANDTMWRTWLPDDAYLVPATISSVKTTQSQIVFDGVTYTRMIAPDAVYKSQRTTTSTRSNVTWTFAVDGESSSYVVRLHFCAFEELSSVVGQGVEFNVYLMKSMATKDLKAKDYATRNMPIQAFYVDYVTTVPAGGENLTVSIGRAASNNDSKEAILNGLEIMKVRTTEMTPANSSGKSSTSKAVIASIAAVLGVAILSGISLCVLFVRRRRQRRATQPSPEEEMEEKESVTTPWSPFTPDGEGSVSTGSSAVTPRRMNMKLHIPFAEIMVATGGFSDANLLGVGGFGNVYRGVLRDGTRVAVKRAKRASRQGFPEFQTEIIVLSSIRHRHLVSLIGYCNERSEMILVYELMEHGTLRSHLYGSGSGDGDDASPPPPPLSWKQRLEICIGAAKGLHYLHSGHSDNIIHRDVKSTNILLGGGGGGDGGGIVAKVADFGLSRIGPAVGETHVSTAVKGSFGYLDPEYFKTRQLTDRSDVYSFGVVLFEALCARPVIDQSLPQEEINLAEWAMQLSKKGKFERIVDPAILAAGDANMNSLRKFAETAGRCIADYGEHRPSMGDVVWNLEYCLQLQESQTDSGETALDDSAAHLPRDFVVARRVVAAPPLGRNASVDAGEDMSWSETASFTESGNVFSQIMSRDGR